MNFPRLAQLVLLVPAADSADETIQVSVGERQLFLDDHGIATIKGLQRTMHQPEKRVPVVKPDVPSDGNWLELRAAPMWDETERIADRGLSQPVFVDEDPALGKPRRPGPPTWRAARDLLTCTRPGSKRPASIPGGWNNESYFTHE